MVTPKGPPLQVTRWGKVEGSGGLRESGRVCVCVCGWVVVVGG